jgi:hypothetical protein
MADYEAAPEGGIREAGAEQPVAAPAAEEVKNDAAPTPEATPAVEPEEKPEGDEAPAKEEPVKEPEGAPEE